MGDTKLKKNRGDEKLKKSRGESPSAREEYPLFDAMRLSENQRGHAGNGVVYVHWQKEYIKKGLSICSHLTLGNVNPDLSRYLEEIGAAEDRYRRQFGDISTSR